MCDDVKLYSKNEDHKEIGNRAFVHLLFLLLNAFIWQFTKQKKIVLVSDSLRISDNSYNTTTNIYFIILYYSNQFTINYLSLVELMKEKF